MNNLRIKSIQDVERLLWLFFRYIPQLPTRWSYMMANLTPYIATVIAGYLFTIALLPLIFSTYPFDPLKNADLFTYNIFLSRILFFMMGTIIAVSFNKLAEKRLDGWYNMFYLTLFHLFLLLVLVNGYSLLSLLCTWYVLFCIKPHFS